MADQPSSTQRYEELIARAVASLPTDPYERHATYSRAREAQVTRLRAMVPPLPEVAIEAEQAALDAAIQRVETRFSHAGARAAEPQQTAVSEPQPASAPHLDRRRSGVLIAMLCCVAITGALLIGLFSYGRWSSVGKSARQETRQAVVPPAERAETARNSASSAPSVMPYVFRRQLVHYRSTSPAGTLVVDKAQRYLYVILANVTAIRYGIALGGNCAETAGPYLVSRKMTASGDSSRNQALYLDSEIHLIHGTDTSQSIGQSVRRGCFLLIEPDFAELYGRVPVGTRVVVN